MQNSVLFSFKNNYSESRKKLGSNYWSNGNSLIEAEKFPVFMVDECHLLWVALLSYIVILIEIETSISWYNSRLVQKKFSNII